MTTATIELFRTATGQRLHIAECPHVLGALLFEATEQDQASREVCRWCAAELAEEGRTYHDAIEAALLDMGAPQHVVPELARHLSTVEHDRVFVPFSRSYVAVARDGRSMAWAGVTYIGFRDGRKVLLPGYAPGGGGGNRTSDAWGETCLDCFTSRSLMGECGCD